MQRLISTSVFAALLASVCLPAMADNQQPGKRIEVAFVLDTTGSMAGLIDGAKRKIWSIANTVVDIHPDADIRMALIGYRDRGDDYVVKTFDMSSDLQGLYGNLIRFQADGGGDTPESVNEALHAAVHDLKWSKDNESRRIIFLVGDAPPHMDYANAPKYPEVIKEAQESNILINAVQAGNDDQTRNIWKDIAARGHGRYIPIPQDGGKVRVVESPYDNNIIELQKKIDDTVIPYGSAKEQSEVRAKMEEKAAAPAPVKVDNSKFYSKRSSVKEVVTGGGDLVADLRNGAKELDKVADDELPPEIKSMSAQERKSAIEAKVAERIKLEDEMAGLVKQRDDYVAQKSLEIADDRADSFDQVVQDTLKAQLK